jgi:hypothetical protein
MATMMLGEVAPGGTGSGLYGLLVLAVITVFVAGLMVGRSTVTRVVSLNEACPATPFLADYQGVAVECARFGEDYSHGIVTPVRGNAPAKPAVPADAVTASGSGLDPNISPAYARLQAPRGARTSSATTDVAISCDRGPGDRGQSGSRVSHSRRSRRGRSRRSRCDGADPEPPPYPTWTPGRRSGSGSFLRMISRTTGAVSPRPSRK